MSDSWSKAVRVGIEGVFYSLTHVPDLVRYGSKPSREIRANPALGEELTKRLSDFPRRRLMRRIKFTLAISRRKNSAVCQNLGMKN